MCERGDERVGSSPLITSHFSPITHHASRRCLCLVRFRDVRIPHPHTTTAEQLVCQFLTSCGTIIYKSRRGGTSLTIEKAHDQPAQSRKVHRNRAHPHLAAAPDHGRHPRG